MRVSAALDLREVPVDVRNLLLDLDRVHVDDAVAIGLQDGHLAVFEIDDLARMRENRRDVAGDEVLVFAQSEEQRASLARGDDLVGVDARDHRDAVRPLDLKQRFEHRILEIPVEALLDEVREHFGVGIGGEHVATPLQHLLEDRRVLDDAVVDDGDAAVLAHVRMRVLLIGRTVRRPARVRDAGRPLDRSRVQEQLQLGDLARLLHRFDARAIHDGDARRIIAAIFETLEPLEQEGRRHLGSNVSDDSAHGVFEWI